jgi:hypothetical protein
MARALYGHMATVDARLTAEVRRLRGRVADLEAEVARLRAESTVDSSALIAELRLDLREPAQV